MQNFQSAAIFANFRTLWNPPLTLLYASQGGVKGVKPTCNLYTNPIMVKGHKCQKRGDSFFLSMYYIIEIANDWDIFCTFLDSCMTNQKYDEAFINGKK